MTKPFLTIRTHDVVLHQNRRCLVIGIQTSATKGIQFQLVPLSNEVISASYDDIRLASLDEQDRREGRAPVQHLRAAQVAERAWKLGEQKAAQPTVKSARKPFNLADIQLRIKTQIARQAKGEILTQPLFDDIVRRVVAAQAYVVTCAGRKPTKTMSVPGWQQIAAEAVRIGNAYNRNLRGITP